MTGAVLAAASPRITVTATPDVVMGIGTQTGIASVETVGLAAPLSYLWTVTGDALTPQSPTFASTRFEGSPPSAETFIVTAICTVTDAIGRVRASNTITAQLTGI